MRYECSPKHKRPWQRGRRGSLCPKAMDEATAESLLSDSEQVRNRWYAVHEGRAYCAQDDGADVWHGYPVGWVDVPESLRRKWRKEGRLRKRDMRTHWDG